MPQKPATGRARTERLAKNPEVYKVVPIVKQLVLGFSALLLTAASPRNEGTIRLKDLTPKFLTFYRAAKSEHASPERRFQLWKQDYGFATVPPTPEGDRIARKLLDEAWPKYPSVMARIEKGAAGIHPSPEATLRRVVALLKPGKPIHVNLIVFVGELEENTFTVGQNGTATVAIPVEEDSYDLGPAMAQEFTHAVRIDMGMSSGGWIRTIGETTLDLGLALRVTQQLYPHRPPASYLETASEPGWFANAEARRFAVLRDVRAALGSNSSDDVMRFTMGKGPSGLDREAYYAGWSVVGYWLKHGMTLADIIRIPEADAPDRVRAAIDAILHGG
ncbi:MAG: hypothetical protein ACRED9_14635 [Caulobacteraceae bacterium]